MKKIIALLIAIMMLATLAACTKDEGPASPSTSASASTSPSASDAPSASASTPASTESSTQASASPEGSAPAGPTDPSVNANSIGFFFDDVDPHSRRTYDIVWAYMRPMALFLNIHDAMVELEDVLNFKLTGYCANSDIDAMLQNIEIFADQGVDGYIIVIDATANMRIKEVLDETGLPYIGILNSVRDSNGSEIVPLIGMEGFTIGHMMTQWLYDNYKKYWGDIDTSKIGMLNYTFSPNIDFHERHLGNIEKFNELLPGNGDLIFPADGVSGALDEQTGYDLASAIFAGHPEVEYWFVPSCLELYAFAASRAAETLNMEDRVLITTANSDVLSAQWDNGYDGCFVSCIATHALQYAAPALSGLVSLINGTSTFDTLWSTIRNPRDLYTYFEMDVEILTIDTYKAFFDRVRAESGL
ncbi:MAG: hypothetical protein FWG48_04420 [Oscillospiraceae bacterium]|nr:hypothetical protein [Oscillospiraceae bacterium]